MFARAACNLLRRSGVRRFFDYRVVVVDYPFDPTPRWQAGNPTIGNLLARHRETFNATIAGMNTVLPVAETITPGFWANEWVPPVDAIALMSFIARNEPRTYFEVGSGYSTVAARHAVKALGLNTRIISMDPKPRAEVDALCDTVIRAPFEKIAPENYLEITSGDVVFVDNSHYCFQGSDVMTVFLDLIPSLPAGVVVGIHDIFLPFDYPDVWRQRFYNEQYVFAAYLLGLGDRARVELPAFLVTNDESYSSDLKTIRSFLDGKNARFQGCAFWFVSCEA
jgi:hypothetical protein